MCQFFMPTTLEQNPLQPHAAAGPVATAAAAWRDHLVAEAPALEAFSVGVLVGHGQAVAARAYVDAAAALRRERGDAALLGWQFGVALAQAGETVRRTSRTDAAGFAALAPALQHETVEALAQTLAPLGEELGHALLLAAVGQISIDEAALLLSLPLATVRVRIAPALQALFARLHLRAA